MALTNGRIGPLTDSCSLGWEEGPTGVPNQWLRRTAIASVCLSGACRLEPGSERPFMPWVPSGITNTCPA